MAGSNEIRIDVVATDQASQTLDDVTEKVENLEDAKAKVAVEADTGSAESDIESVADEAAQLDATDVDVNVQTSGDTSGIGTAAADVDHLASSATSAQGGLSGFGQKLDSAAGFAGALAQPIAESSDAAGTAVGVFGGLGATVQTLGPQMGIAADDAATLGTALGIAGVAAGAAATAWGLYAKKQAEASEETARIAEALGHVNESLKEGDLTQAAEQFTEAIPDIGDRAEQFGLTIDQLTDGLRGNQQALLEQVIANENAGTAANGAGVDMAFLLSQYNQSAAAAAGVASDNQQVADSFANTAAGIAAEQLALQNLQTARMAIADSRIALEDANRAFTESITASTTAQDAYNTAVAQYGPNSAEAAAASQTYQTAILSERDAAISAAEAELQRQEDLAAGAGITLSAEAKVSALNKSLVASAQTATPAARAEIIRYIADINGISEKRATDILANADTATAERELNDAARDRTSTIVAKVVGSLDKAALAAAAGVPLSAGRNTGIPPSLVTQPGAGLMARGAAVAGGESWLGPLSGASAVPIMVSNTYKIDVRVPANAHPSEVGRAIVNDIRAFERSAGNGWRRS